MSVQTTITRQDPAIEAYRLGLLGDVQGLIRNQMFGQQVQNLRGMGYTDEQIASQLSLPGQGTEGEEGYIAPTTYSAEDIGQVPIGASFAPPDYQVAGLTRPQLDAIKLAEAGVGAYKPYLSQGLTDLRQAAADQRQSIGDMRGATQLGEQLGLKAYDVMGRIPEQARGIAGTALSKTDLAAQRARQSTAAAQQALMGAGQFGQTAAQQGIAGLAGAAQQFSPQAISAFMSPYQQDVIDTSLADLERFYDRRRAQEENRLAAEAVARGAFSGEAGRRRAEAQVLDPMEEEFQRNVASTIAGVRQQGYVDAATRAQQAFEQARARQLQAAQARGSLGQMGAGTAMSAAGQSGQLALSAEQLAQTGAIQGGQLGMSAEQLAGQMAANQGQLGINIGQLGQAGATGASNIGAQLGQTGVQTAGMGELGQTLSNRDINALMTTGGMQQAQDQSVLDAIRMSGVQAYQQPFQQLGFLSDVYAGIPTSQSTQTMNTGSNASPFMQAASIGIAGLSAASGAQRAGIL